MASLHSSPAPRSPVPRLGLLLAALLVLLPLMGSGLAAATPGDHHPPGHSTTVRLIGINDLHGHLQPPSGSSGEVTLSDGSTVSAGGAAYLASHIQALGRQQPRSMVLTAGDSIGASPLPSALFHDEPTIEFLNRVGVRASALGNHEFDEGYAELLRMQLGGCHPTDGCQFRPHFTGARFPFLGANVTFDRSGLPAAKPYTIRRVGGVRVGVIGLPLQGVPDVVSREAVQGLEFGPEVDAIDYYAKELEAKGVQAIVVSLHQGDETEPGGPNECTDVPGPARAIAEKADPAVDAIFSGHSHQAYNCRVDDPAGAPRPFIQGGSFGRLLSVVDLAVNRRTGEVDRAATTAHNEIVTRDVRPDRRIQRLVDTAVDKSEVVGKRPVGSISEDITRTQDGSGESPLGNVIADAQLAGTSGSGAQLALMNPGGIRADLGFAPQSGEGQGVVTYGEAYATQPFGNILQTATLTGSQLTAVLEQQWQPQPDGSVRFIPLQPSSSLRYSWSRRAPVGSKVSNVTIGGDPLRPDAEYRVTVNNFLLGGGDGFSSLTKATGVSGGGIDLAVLIDYLGAHPDLAAPATDRITVTG